MTPATIPPFYLNWTFWAVVIATLALVLSQLPPLYNLLKRAKLELELYSRIVITHKVGNPNAHVNLILINIGGKTVRIKGAALILKREGKDIGALTAQNYFRNPADITTNVLFTPFTLKPRDEWNYSVQFFKVFSREVEKNYRMAEKALREDIFRKKELPENKDKIVEAEGELVRPFLDMFQAMFEWKPGEYEMQVSIDTVPERACVQQRYRFTLFESDCAELTKYQEDYKIGDGIYFDARPKGIAVPINEA